MAGNVWWMAFFTALALVIVVAIFGSALRWVNSVRAKNVRIKWVTREANRPK